MLFIEGVPEYIQKRVVALTSEITGADPSHIEADDSFADLGADSLDVVELAQMFEEEFDIKIPDDKLGTIRTVGDAARYVEEQLEE